MKQNINLPKQIEFDEAALQLLKALEKENKTVKDFLIRGYKGLPTSLEMEEESYNYFIKHSVIITSMTTFPGSSVFTEFLYEGLSPSFPIDKYVLQSKAGKAVKARLIAIERELPKIIEEYRSKGDVLIGNLGSGPGRDVIDVLSTHYQNISNIKAIHIDKDVVALKRGKRIAKIKRVDHLIEFVQGSFLKYNPTKKFDIILLIGVLCPLEIETCIIVLRAIKKLLKREGCLIVSNATKKMQKEDPFTYFIMRWAANWELVFKDDEEIKQIFEKAGYLWRKGFRDSYGFHLMGVGTSIS